MHTSTLRNYLADIPVKVIDKEGPMDSIRSEFLDKHPR